jgi:hypothetical protein
MLTNLNRGSGSAAARIVDLHSLFEAFLAAISAAAARRLVMVMW